MIIGCSWSASCCNYFLIIFWRRRLGDRWRISSNGIIYAIMTKYIIMLLWLKSWQKFKRVEEPKTNTVCMFCLKNDEKTPWDTTLQYRYQSSLWIVGKMLQRYYRILPAHDCTLRGREVGDAHGWSFRMEYCQRFNLSRGPLLPLVLSVGGERRRLVMIPIVDEEKNLSLM